MLVRFFKKIHSKFDAHMQELVRGAFLAFALKIVAAGLAFGLNVVLARLLGADGSGIFFLVYTIVVVTATLSRVGMENVLIRFIAGNIAAQKPQKVLGVYSQAMLYAFVAGVLLTLLLYSLSPWLGVVVFAKPEIILPLRIMAFSIVPLALLTLHAYALQGVKKIAASVSVLSIFVPSLTIFSAIFFVPLHGINAVAVGYLTATLVTLIIGRYFWKSVTSSFLECDTECEKNELFTSSIPLFVIVIMNMVITWSPIFFLGIWTSSQQLGIYSAANRTAMLTSFVLVAVNSIAAPKFAELYQNKEMATLGQLARNSTKIMVLLASPALFLFMLAPEWILSVFGEQFKEGAVVLMILAAGQFVNVATGSVGYLLMMTGNEKMMRNNLVCCAFLGIFLNVYLISRYGVVGGACAATILLILQNLIAVVFVWRKLGIVTIPWIGSVVKQW